MGVLYLLSSDLSLHKRGGGKLKSFIKRSSPMLAWPNLRLKQSKHKLIMFLCRRMQASG